MIVYSVNPHSRYPVYLCIDPETQVEFDTVVHPGIIATHHQHILSLRIDPAIGDYHSGNSLACQESYAFNMSRHSILTVMDIFLRHTLSRNLRVLMLIHKEDDRAWFRTQIYWIKSIIAWSHTRFPHLQCKRILASPNSFHFRRDEFADHEIYVTKYAEDEHFSRRKFTNQSRGGHGIEKWGFSKRQCH